jgi:hypothetical protein
MRTRTRWVLGPAAILLWMPIALQATPVFTAHASSRTDRQDAAPGSWAPTGGLPEARRTLGRCAP